MRALPPLRRSVFVAVFFLLGVLLAANSAPAQTLTFTGQVYSPLGPPVTGSTAPHGDPIPNILVFVQDPNSPLPTFSQGVAVPTANQQGCSIQPSLVPANVLGSNLTDYSGTYTFNVSGAVPDPITVVIQAGKWRRQYQFTQAQIASYTTGTVVTLPPMSMPSSQSQGDLPHIAVVTGNADAIECIFPQIGIATSEFTDPGNGGSINLFSGNAGTGEVFGSSSPTETQLVNPAATGAIPITNYDMVIFGCQSWASGSVDSDYAYASTVESYANEGGRVFGTHGEDGWISRNAAWNGIASFGGSTSSGGTLTGQLSTSYTGEPILAAWMNYIGALDVSAANLQFTLTSVFYNLTSVSSPGETWVTLPSYKNAPNQFSFDTPVAATGVPTAALNFSNAQTSFALGDTGDSITISVLDNSSTATLSGLTLTLQIPAGISPTSLVDSSGGAWTCTISTPATSATCVLPTPLTPGVPDAVKLSFDIPLTATPGSATLIATLSNGGLNKSNQCGRVLYNDYHVENVPSDVSVSRAAFNNGATCKLISSSSSLSSAQKFLEYSLYNLSNFVAPTTSDTIVIQAPSTTVITTNGNPGVTTPIYYGQIIGDTNGVNAVVSTTAPSGTGDGTLSVSINGTVVCMLPNDGSQGMCPNAGFSGQNVGTYKVVGSFSGDTIYQPSSSDPYPVVVQADATATALSVSTPVVYANPATLTATVTNIANFSDVPKPTPTGTVTFYDISGATPINLGTATVNSAGVATLTLSTLSVGTHSISASFASSVNTPSGTTNFLASTTAGVPLVVNLPQSTTTTSVGSSANPSYQGENVIFTATVVQQPFTITVPAGLSNPAPTGTVTFYDGTMALGTATLGANLTATYATSALAVGTHPITAVYSGDTANVTSTSAVLSQVVQPNTFTMTVNPTALNLIIGSAATITVSVVDNGNFNEPVTLTCSGISSETSCNFASATIPAGGGTTTLTVVPQPPHPCTTTTSSNRQPGSRWPMFAGAGVLLLAARRRKKLLGLVTFGLALAVLPLLNGCGTSGCTDFGMYPGSYTFTVTATSAAPYSETQNQTMTMVVKP